MKKIILFATVALTMVACTSWENKSTEFKVTGVWTGVNQEININAGVLLDSSETRVDTISTANFMEDGSLVIDSAGTQLDSLGWSIVNDTILVLSGIDLGIDNPLSGGSAVAPGALAFDILTLTQESFVFRYDTTLTQTIPGIPFPVSINLNYTQRWAK